MPFNSGRKLIREENLTKISLGRRLIKRVSLFSDLLLFGKEVGKRGIVDVNTSTEISKISIATITDELRLTIKFGNKQATFMTPSKESQTAWAQCINEAKSSAAKAGNNKKTRTPRRSTYDSKQLTSTTNSTKPKEEPRPKSFNRPKSTRFEELFGKRFGGQLINKTEKMKSVRQIKRPKTSAKPPTPHRPRSTRFEEIFGSRFGHSGLSWHDNPLPNVLSLETLKQELEEAENQVKQLTREVAHLEQGRVRRERQISCLQSQLPETVSTLKDLRRKSTRLGLSIPEGSDSSSDEENDDVTYLPPDKDLQLTPVPEADLGPPTPGEDDIIWELHSDEDHEDFDELDTPTPAALSFESLDRIPSQIDVMTAFSPAVPDSAAESTVSAPASEKPLFADDGTFEDLPLPPTDVPEFIEVDGMHIRVVSEADAPPTHDPRYSGRIDSWEAAQFAGSHLSV